ncbi:DUF3558 domain-containing protein [Nocardioides alkalitolerans]|uniref:DUF3558 domain-containing protein n=1 Tax=Nocardioides alkalitolerans TaxID=281714 RepID=UPI0003FAA655|nr:DUF3558 domain-containing protein [Nocardioides alkalitolerans]
MRTTRNHLRTGTRTAAGVLLVAVLSACGSGTGDDSGTDAGTDAGTTSDAAAGDDWRTVDACTLLTADDLAPYLEDPATPGVDDSADGRPGCVWEGADGFASVRVMLWAPPAPEVQQGGDALTVGDAAGYVTSQTATSCLVDVEAEPAWVQLDARASSDLVPDGVDDTTFCSEVAAPTAQAVLDRVG